MRTRRRRGARQRITVAMAVTSIVLTPILLFVHVGSPLGVVLGPVNAVCWVAVVVDAIKRLADPEVTRRSWR